MAVPNIFANASPARLADLDANFAYLVNNPVFVQQQTLKAYAGSAVGVANDTQVTISGTGQDVGAIRGFATLAASTVNGFPRGVESQTSIPTGATFTQAFGMEVGLHSQVAGSGSASAPTSIGLYLASSHSGWLASGVRNDCGLFVGGEDGWVSPILCMGTDFATTLFRVSQVGDVLAHGTLTTNGQGGDLCGIINVSTGAVGQTYSGMRYDGTHNCLVLEALTQGTAYRNVSIVPNGGNVLIGNTTDDGTGAQLQTTGFPRFCNATAAPAGGSSAARIAMGPTGTVSIYYGSGAPSVSAAKGSLYLRTDGSGTTNRAYINTDASTTWTAITTSA